MADDFASMFEQSGTASGRGAQRLEAGQKITGTVLEISGGLVVLDIGSNADATIDLLEFEERPVKVGDQVSATVSNPRSDGPVLTLALGKGGAGVSTATLELACSSQTPVSGTVVASNKGGFSVEVAGVRAFCPISQIDAAYVNEPDVFVGQTFDFLVTEVRESGRNVVLSRRRLLQEERRKSEEELVATLAPGAIVSGTVKKTVRHGAILDLGGADAFIPISELARARIDTPEDVVSLGETVQAQVLSVERGEKGLSIRLSMKALEAPSPDKGAEKDEILEGKVVRHVPGGLIVGTDKGEGLVPTRELSLAPGADHRRSYPIEMSLRVVVVNRDGTSGKLRLSVGRVAQVEERNNFREFGKDTEGEQAPTLGSLGDLMKRNLGALHEMAAKNPAPTATRNASASPDPIVQAAASHPKLNDPAPAPKKRTSQPGKKRDANLLGVVRRKRNESPS